MHGISAFDRLTLFHMVIAIISWFLFCVINGLDDLSHLRQFARYPEHTYDDDYADYDYVGAGYKRDLVFIILHLTNTDEELLSVLAPLIMFHYAS